MSDQWFIEKGAPPQVVLRIVNEGETLAVRQTEPVKGDEIQLLVDIWTPERENHTETWVGHRDRSRPLWWLVPIAKECMLVQYKVIQKEQPPPSLEPRQTRPSQSNQKK